MFITTPATYIGKENLERYIQNLPITEKEIQVSEAIDLSIKAYKLYERGLPYSRRAECLYYFYHFYPIHNEDSNPEVLEKLILLNGYAEQLQNDKKIIRYLGLLEPKKYIEVFQKRGVIEAYNSGLENYLNFMPDIEWEKIQDRVLTFVESEPICTQYILEKMFSGLSKYYSDNNLKTSVRYKIAQKIWESSTDEDSLQSAWLCLNNPEDVFEYKKSTLPEAEVEKLLKLEKLEKEIMKTFDESRLGRPEKRIFNQLFADDLCLSWLRLIDDRIDLFNNDDYVKGYAEFLRGYVCYASGHLERACKELDMAYFHQYNPVLVLMYIVNILEDLNRSNEAVKYAQEAVKIISAGPEDLKSEECLQKIAGVLSGTNTEPAESSTMVNRKRKENEIKKREMINFSILEKTEANRRNDLLDRIKCGIALFDNLIDPGRINKMAEDPEKLDEVSVTIPVSETEALGLNEIELFNYKIENNDDNKIPKVTLRELIEYNTHLIKERNAELNGAMDLISEFPNSLACIFITKTNQPVPVVKKSHTEQSSQNNSREQKLSAVNDQLAIEDPQQYRRYLLTFGMFIIIISIILIISLLI